MAINETINIPAHYNIYTGSNNRELRIEFSIPEQGTNENTGLLLFVPGFSGHIDSNIYKKMRAYFSDNFNLVTIQCDYFGNKYMQSAQNVHLNGDFNSISHYFSEAELKEIYEDHSKALSYLRQKEAYIKVLAKIDESPEEFAELGFMQAIDNITAIEAIKIILTNNNLSYNSKKIIGYGHSQGAYLLSVANRLAPSLFSHIIDNSGWIKPEFLYRNRLLIDYDNQLRREIEFDYFGKKYLKDLEAQNLNNLFNEFKNGAYHKLYIGTTDFLVSVEAKKNCYGNLDYVDFDVIGNDEVDGLAIKSTNHGLQADFLLLLERTLAEIPNHENTISFEEEYFITSSRTNILVDYSNPLPLFYFKTN